MAVDLLPSPTVQLTRSPFQTIQQGQKDSRDNRLDAAVLWKAFGCVGCGFVLCLHGDLCAFAFTDCTLKRKKEQVPLCRLVACHPSYHGLPVD
ncbi:hypothetical protein DPEC_G00060560 [Dallia pectoralis]|uniref:Uncharacterized protein n=1 Tax=Dallia pectoralis TaxID=75939 RepID=A0ACC2H7L1_DALPE|nr:hypothetical protein DPEC_G00060560 [Dallia pectoralis]